MKSKKMSKSDLKNLRWGSHIPCNLSVIKSFPITGILELGAGINSTPLFFNNCDYVISVESDINWINKLKNENIVNETQNHKLVHHKVPVEINRSTLRKDIPIDILDDAVHLYNSLIDPRMNYLFVDCYAGFRLEALNKLHHQFDIIVYHDAEPRFEYCYSYSKFVPNKEYIHLIDQTFPAHVGIIISRKFEKLIENFKNNLKIESKIYSDEFNFNSEFLIEEK